MVESAQFRDLAIFTKWSNSRLVKFDQWFINGSLTFMTDEPARAAIPLKLEAHASREHTLAGPLWEGYHESRRCSGDTCPESDITEYTLVYEEKHATSQQISIGNPSEEDNQVVIDSGLLGSTLGRRGDI